MKSKAFDIRSVKGLTQDSRRVKKGYLFAALPGSRTDGRKFISEALRAGAAAVLTQSSTILPAEFSKKDITLILDENPRRRFAQMAAGFYGAQPGYIAAVTGTNGKTSAVHFARQIWRNLGEAAASIGTLGVCANGKTQPGSMTTPDPVSLHAELADLAAAGVTHLALEASSHGLDQHRLDGVRLSAAGFTNLSRDHLDYHGTEEAYLSAKTRLFSELLPKGAAAILNADIKEFDRLHEICTDKSHKILSYGKTGRDLRLVKTRAVPGGQALDLKIFGKTHTLTLPLVGGFQVMNALCALGLVAADNKNKIEKALKALENLKSVPGRLELVPGGLKDAAIYIDYAHTPQALETVLQALRPHTPGRLVCLFGCGGDRDKGKRPLMGRVAARLADHVIVTDDNPRSEDPAVIRREIMEGLPGAEEIQGRRLAIRKAVSDLKKGDVLLIAGKGHEQGQVFADRTAPFDDREEAQNATKELETS